MPKQRILAIGDVHSPWTAKEFLPALIKTTKQYRPDSFIIGGDLIDSLAINNHGAPADAPDATTEFKLAQKSIRSIADVIGNKPCRYIVANHEMRITRMASTLRIPSMCIKTLQEIFILPKHWQLAREFIVDGVYYTHFKSGTPGRLALSMGMPAMQFHQHSKFSLEYFTTASRTLWQAQGGSWADEDTLAFAYAKDTLQKSVRGFFIVDHGVPLMIKC